MAINKVFFYIPNLIGYSRIILALLSLSLMRVEGREVESIILYFTSCLLDAADGWAARYYNQSSIFGAVLDMVTDRCTTAALLLHLSNLYSTQTFILQTLLSLDFASHYMHMVSSEKSGLVSHKSLDQSSTPYLLYLYYTHRPTLFLVCAGNEAFFMLLYCYAHPQVFVREWVVVGLVGCGVVMAFKQGMNVVQLGQAALILADLDSKNVVKNGTSTVSSSKSSSSSSSTRKSPRRKKVV